MNQVVMPAPVAVSSAPIAMVANDPNGNFVVDASQGVNTAV